MRLSVFPLDWYAWRRALRSTGYSGMALISLMIAESGQFHPAGSVSAHQSTLAIFSFRAPFTLLAIFFILSDATFARITLRDFRAWFFLFATYFLASTAWSIEPLATFGKSVELFIALAIVLHLCRRPDALDALDGLRHLLLLTISSIGLLAISGYLLDIDAFVTHRPGILTSTTAEAPFLSGNGVGYISSALLLSVFAEWQSGRLPRNSAMRQMAYASFLFLFAGSRTSLVILTLGIGAVLLRKSKALFAVSAICFTAALFVFWDKVLKVIHNNQVQSNFETLSGRTIMWAAALRYWLERPLIGYGGGSGGKYVIAHLSNQSLQVLRSLHDGFLEALTGLGVLGFVLAMTLFVAVSFSTVRWWKRAPQRAGMYVLIIHIWLTTLMSIGVLGWMNYEIMFYLILMATLDVERRQQRWTTTMAEPIEQTGVLASV
jgi:O-antigen ligase